MTILDFIRDLDNEKQLEIYLQYKKDLNITYQETFENWLEDNYIEVDGEWIFNNGDYVKCPNCGEWVEEDYMRWIADEQVCEQCMIDGYGS